MSNFNRSSKYANSAIVVSINHDESFGSEDIFAGLNFRNSLEKAGFDLVQTAGGDKHLPKQRVTDFIHRRSGDVTKGSTPSGGIATRLDGLFSDSIHKHMVEALEVFDRRMKGFISDEAEFFGVESRTSCPIRITRDSDSLQSISHPGLYPTGEGAGYAGGITSAACDGIRVAEKIFEMVKS